MADPHPRVRQLIEALDLAPHPEGGHYREVHRSPATVLPGDGRGARAALTTIYFLLAAGERSRWHRVNADEAWHHYEGAPLELLTMDPDCTSMEQRWLGPLEADAAPVHVVRANDWQAARTTGDYTLVGCSVGPGFDFSDFALLRDVPALAGDLDRRLPAAVPLL